MLELNKIYNIDCLVGMTEIADETIDMIFCDLPYGVTAKKQVGQCHSLRANVGTV